MKTETPSLLRRAYGGQALLRNQGEGQALVRQADAGQAPLRKTGEGRALVRRADGEQPLPRETREGQVLIRQDSGARVPVLPARDTPALGLAEVEAARRRLAHGLRLTPCAIAPALVEITGRTIWLKRDDLQRTGSFKERGARHALLCLTELERARGVVAASAGNHALGLAYHGAQLGVRVTVVMPTTAPAIKVARCHSLGAEVVLHGSSFEDAQSYALAMAADSTACLVHPFDDPRVIAGQGTMALEILEQAPQLDTIVVPVGGGGLLAGITTVVKTLRPDVRVVAVEPESAAAFSAALQHGGPMTDALGQTIADGLAVARVGTQTFALAASRVDDVVRVAEHEIGAAMALLARRCGAVVEGAGAAPLAAVLAGKISGRAIVLPVGGRNIDARVHAEILEAHPEATSGRMLVEAAA